MGSTSTTFGAAVVSLGDTDGDGISEDMVRLLPVKSTQTSEFDYKSLRAGIKALEFEKVDKSKPLYAEINLPSTSARIVVVKKNKAVLKKLVKDLKSIKTKRDEIPALIIDDESDQASVNTSNPKTWAAVLPGADRMGFIATVVLGGLVAHIPLTALAAILMVVAWRIAEAPVGFRSLSASPPR